jgi:DNA-binding FrmR family transcriptional regulator
MQQDDFVKVECELHLILENLKTVTCMMEDHQPCTQILYKIGMIQRTLQLLRDSLLACQVRESIAFIQNNSDPDACAMEISRLPDLYKEMIQTPFLKNEVK